MVPAVRISVRLLIYPSAPNNFIGLRRSVFVTFLE